MLHKFVFMTVKQAHAYLGGSFSYINTRLRRLAETNYLGREQQNAFAEHIYWLARKGAEVGMARGAVPKPWSIQKKSKMQIPHDAGITSCLMLLDREFPNMQCRRWKTDLEKDFEGEIPDLFFDLQDGVGWCPFEYVVTNPLSRDKMRDYANGYERTYVVLPTLKAVQFALQTANELNLTNANRLWFTYEELFLSEPKGKIWWNPKTMGDKAYSILKPEIYD